MLEHVHLEPDWLAKAIASVKAEVATWPAWMRPGPAMSDSMPKLGDVVWRVWCGHVQQLVYSDSLIFPAATFHETKLSALREAVEQMSIIAKQSRELLRQAAGDVRRAENRLAVVKRQLAAEKRRAKP